MGTTKKAATYPTVTCHLQYARDGAKYAQKLSEKLDRAGVLTRVALQRSSDTLALIRRLFNEEFDAIIYIATAAARLPPPTLMRRFRRIIVVAFDDELRRSLWTIASELVVIEPTEAKRRGPTPDALAEILHVLRVGPVARTRPTPTRKPRTRKRLTTTRPLNEAKLILVGRGEVGKTSLVRRLLGRPFSGDESKTQGINISNWPLKVGRTTYRLNIWDFGGQEIMHATHQFFLTERSLYLLVLNGREGGEDLDAEYWLKHIESFGGQSPVIVVQNKIGQHPFELNYRGLQLRYPQIRGFVRTDCRDDTGLDELTKTIRTVVSKGMPEVRTKFPADWFAVKEKLEASKDEFMAYERFRRLCADQGVRDEADRDTLSVVLHYLGIALNYRDDARLRETSVLKPEWVTESIYTILNAPMLAERRGELHLRDLAEILPAKRYPQDKHLFLMELMRKFSLCFAFPFEPDRYLIPELLGKEEPEDTRDFRPEDCLNFEYKYSVLPEGLMPRFIVRSHTLSRDQPRWRFGAILAHESCKGLVTTLPAEQRVIVRVKGGDAGARRRLLAIIRYDFDRINAEFKDRLDRPRVPLTRHPDVAVDYEKLLAFEKQGVTTFPEYVSDRVITVNVGELLNGVDLQEQRQATAAALVHAKSVFFSYSHKDETLRDELETHLKLLQRLGVLSAWHDRKILPGKEWDGEIDMHLERARILLLLVSADFLASDYCWDKEVTRAMERHEAGEATVIPIMLRPCDWNGAPFAKLQGLPTNMKPVTEFENRDAAWKNVATGLRKIAQSLS